MKTWLWNLLDPTLPGMDDTSPRAKPLAFAAMIAVIGLLAHARYNLGVLNTAQAQGPTVILGIVGCVGVLVLFHGPRVLAAAGWDTWRALGIGIGAYLLFWYFGRSNAFEAWFLPLIGKMHGEVPLLAWTYFCVNNFTLLLLPALAMAWLWGGLDPRQLGLWLPSANRHPPGVERLWPLYLAAFAVTLPFVVQVAQTPAFVYRYPLYRHVIGADNALGLTELLFCGLLYLSSFVFLEGFFRGYLLFSTERGLGLYSLVFMAVPYVAGHFGKPMPEAIGAIFAGTALGWLALKHRSIWLGVAVHVSIALVMDVFALWGRGTAITLP